MAVAMKLIAPRMDDTPAKCREKMARSTEAPARAMLPASGGQTVHLVPAPASTVEEEEGWGEQSEAYVTYVWESYVGGTNYRWDKSVSEAPNYNWYNHEEDYYKGMGSDDYIVNLVVAQEGAWLAKFCAHEQAKGGADSINRLVTLLCSIMIANKANSETLPSAHKQQQEVPIILTYLWEASKRGI